MAASNDVSGDGEFATSPNLALAKHLDTIASYYTLERESSDRYRAKTFSDAARLIAEYPFAFTSGENVQEIIPRIGPSSVEVINEFIKSGESSRLTNLEMKHKDRKEIIDVFLQVYGIGPRLANKFYDLGFRSLLDLWYGVPLSLAENFNLVVENLIETADELCILDSETLDKGIENTLTEEELTEIFYSVLKALADKSKYRFPQLTSAQRIGLEHFDDLKLRIPRNEIDEIKQKISDNIPENVLWEITGSYRRNELESGDIDLLLKSNTVNLSFIIAKLVKSGLIIGELARGASKFMGIARLNSETPARRIDILVVPETSWAYALFYFTGSARFNVLVRQRAIKMGYRLNEYGMTNSQGFSFLASTEEEIFEHLNMEYLTPEERSRNIPSL